MLFIQIPRESEIVHAEIVHVVVID
jgi:hypothetical protein